MSTRESTAAQILLDAVEQDPSLRPAFIEKACAGDALLHNRVAALLKAHDQANPLLDGDCLVATLDHAPLEEPGAQVGPYKLRELLAEGGMGSVFVAEQEQPVRRKVALKVIKPGMDSRQVLSRFEAERQALALMDHPNIARVLDAGATDSGRPYFAMELVRGVPITDFCDQRRLAPRQRLELFVQVCRAIQHAHQKGVIHRDIKPSNILVTRHDDLSVPKVIDFGIAKATGQQLTEHTVYTAFNQMIGTPLYMSPEQAEMNALDVDTRSDVYSLGVLLYELLTGSTPFDKETLRQAGFDEMRRLIREVDPPRPSHRISTLDAEALSTVSERRGVDERRLHRALRGDLDWIVMMALEKNRNRRYESASALAADVQRHLDGEPIHARPPRLFDGARKWCRRHRNSTTASTVAAILLLLFATGIAADRRRQTQDTNHFVELSLRAAREALESGNIDEAVQRAGEAQIRIDAVQLVDPVLADEVAALKSESERFAEFLQRFRSARNHPGDQGVVNPSARESLALYQVMENPEWFKSLQQSGFPEAHAKRVGEAVYELLLQNADQLVRWSNHWPEASRKARLEEQCHEAIDLLERAVAFHAPSRGYYWLMANCSLILGDKEKESRLRVTAMETPPNHAAELMYITYDRDWGATSHYRGYPAYTFDEIFKDYIAMLRLDPTYYPAFHMLAYRLGNEGRASEALLVSCGLVAVAPNDFVAILNRGCAHSLLGHYDEAKADYETVLSNCRDSPHLLQTIAYNLATDSVDEMRDGKRAFEIAQRICKLTNYENAELVDTLACAYAETGDFKSAVKWSEVAVELSINHLREEYAKHLESFRQGKPWRDE